MKPVSKCIEMLSGKDSRGNKNCHLLSVHDCFECSADCDFCFSESNISAYKPIHRIFNFHICLNFFRSSVLVRRIFIHKACFKLFLPVSIWGEGKTFLGLSFCVKQNQIARNIFYTFLCALFYLIPFTAAKTRNIRRSFARTRIFFY